MEEDSALAFKGYALQGVARDSSKTYRGFRDRLEELHSYIFVSDEVPD